MNTLLTEEGSNKKSPKMALKQEARAKREGTKVNTGGQTFQAYYVPNDQNPYNMVEWSKRSSKIKDAQGGSVFSMENIEVPESWSQLATDVAVSKYFRKAGVPGTGHETSIRQVVHRIVHTIRSSGEDFGGYFASKSDAEQFEKELAFILLNQIGAFNSPVWFNCGLHHEYGITGSGGNYAYNFKSERISEIANSYERPQCSACFIQSVEDDLMAIFNLAKQEARIFKYGSGTGTNFSKIRGRQETLSGGGLSSGLISFLEVLDRGAGATKSGGTTRRAAKMVCLDIDHPEIEDFINWKVNEERKVQTLVDGGYSSDFNGEAYKTVAGQNSNNSIRIPDQFIERVQKDDTWKTTARTSGETINTYRARELWRQIAYAAWKCADPGVQFDSTIQKWHTCPETDRINGSNPCSEYMFLDDSACNLASLNLEKFLSPDGSFNLEAYRHAVRVLFTAQEILVDLSSYPTERIALNSHDYRPLGLGYANLGTLLMIKGLPYDSPKGRAWAGVLTAIMTGEAYKTSAIIAGSKGAFNGYEKNDESMLRVIRQHGEKVAEIDSSSLPKGLIQAAHEAWTDAAELGRLYGFRNAQATVLAPTGTIGLLMDCDTTGVEPDFSLVKFKKLAGGGYFKIVNQSVPRALSSLGYEPDEVKAIIAYAIGHMTLHGSPHINTESLKAKGLTDEDLHKITKALPTSFDLHAAISPWVLGEERIKSLGIKSEQLSEGRQSVLEALKFTPQQIREANCYICGQQTLEGAPLLKEEHLAVFDCANKCGPGGERFIEPMAHVRMMAAVQPFISGAISKTVNLPHECTVEEIEDIYEQSWKMGLKAVAVYRDGSKLSQPLQSKQEEASADKAIYTEKDLQEAVATAISMASPRRRRLPQKRRGVTVEGRVGGHQIYIRTGEYDDGDLGEVFFDMHKEGATFRSLLNCFAISCSLGLQYGVPLEEYVDKFTFTRFEPQGMVDHPNIKQATSILDYVFRVIGMEYLGKTDFVHVKPAVEDLVINQNQVVNTNEHESIHSGQQLSLSAEKAVVRNSESLPHSTAANTASAPDNLDSHLSQMMGDAPMCTDCGHVTVRNGSCYRCLNCGSSIGCS
jgi:ribonucleoside-diphosphate reductase alpha chain